MKKLLLLSTLLIFACTEDEDNPCIYAPTLTTEAIADITETSATLNGVISVVSENCEVAPGEMQGFVYSTNPSPTNDDNIEVIYGTNISTTIESLEPNTTYYVRAFLTNTIGEFYGNEVDFRSKAIASVNCDGAVYPSIVYGTQEWTVANACHITYTDGTPIPQVTDDAEWYQLTTGAWSYYNNDPTKPRLYNWYAIMGIHDTDPNTPNKEFAPEGWHVPGGSDWGVLERYLIANGYNHDGTTTENKIGKSMASIAGWNSSTTTGAIGNDQGLNNSSGFNALPVGDRSYIGRFVREGGGATFWSSNPYYTTYAWYLVLGSASSEPSWFKNSMKQGLSVRFVKD